MRVPGLNVRPSHTNDFKKKNGLSSGHPASHVVLTLVGPVSVYREWVRQRLSQCHRLRVAGMLSSQEISAMAYPFFFLFLVVVFGCFFLFVCLFVFLVFRNVPCWLKRTLACYYCDLLYGTQLSYSVQYYTILCCGILCHAILYYSTRYYTTLFVVE